MPVRIGHFSPYGSGNWGASVAQDNRMLAQLLTEAELAKGQAMAQAVLGATGSIAQGLDRRGEMQWREEQQRQQELDRWFEQNARDQEQMLAEERRNAEWDRRFRMQNQAYQDRWNQTHPLQRELNKLDEAELQIMSDDSWGPTTGMAEGPVQANQPATVPGTSPRDAALQQIQAKREALYGMMQRSGYGGRQYGPPQFAKDPLGRTYGFVPGSAGIHYSPGQTGYGELTPSQRAGLRARADAMALDWAKQQEQATLEPIAPTEVRNRADEFYDRWVSGTEPMPEGALSAAPAPQSQEDQPVPVSAQDAAALYQGPEHPGFWAAYAKISPGQRQQVADELKARGKAVP